MIRFILKKNVLFLILFLVAFEGVFVQYKIAGVNFPRFIELFFFIYIFKSFLSDFINNRILNNINKMFFVFFLLLFVKLFVVTFIQGDLNINILIDAVRVFTLVIYLYILYYLLKIDIKNINIILAINSIIMFIAFFQSEITPFTNLAWDIKNNYFPTKYEDSITFRKRVVGLYETSIILAYVLVPNMILSIYMYIKTKINLYIVYFFFLGLIAIFSLTRSVVLSWIILFIYLIVIIIKNSSIFQKILFISTLLFVLSYGINVYIQNEKSLNRVSSVDGNSAEGRIPLAITGAYAILKHPLGISAENYEIAKKEMYIILNNKNILKYSSHNGILNVGFQYTLLGLIVLFIYFFKLIKIIRLVIPKEMKFFFFMALLSYLANVLFHNTFMVIDDFYGLILFAIIAYEYSINKNQKELMNGKN